MDKVFKFFGGRKHIALYVFSVGVPVLFSKLGLSETVILSSMAAGTAYCGFNVLDRKVEKSQPKTDEHQ